MAFTDADLPYDLENLRIAYDLIAADQCEVVFGARDLEDSTVLAPRRLLRTAAHQIFSGMMFVLVSREVTDTQCGLKIFSRRAAFEIFARTMIDGFAFDAEVVYLAKRLSLAFCRVPVTLINEYASTISLPARHAACPWSGMWSNCAGEPVGATTFSIECFSPSSMRQCRRSMKGGNCRLREAILREPRRTRSSDIRPETCRTLVLHADDFGMKEPVTEGILSAFRDGLLTSTAILTNAPDCERAISRWKVLQAQLASAQSALGRAARTPARSLPPFDLGIHLNLTQGRPLTADKYPARLLDDAGRFPGVFGLARRLLTSGWQYRAAIERELAAQIEVLLDHGIVPTHLNAHQYIDLFPAVAAIVPELLRRFSIRVVRVPWECGLTRSTLLRRPEPVNWCLGQIKRLFAFRHLIEMTRQGVAHPAAFFGTSHAGRISFDLLQTFVTSAGRGLTEIGMHPGCPILHGAPSAPHGASHDDGWHDPLAHSRSEELSVLTSSELVELLESQHIRLGRLSEIASPASAAKAA